MKEVLKRQAQTGPLRESRPSLPTDRTDPEVPVIHMCTQKEHSTVVSLLSASKHCQLVPLRNHTSQSPPGSPFLKQGKGTALLWSHTSIVPQNILLEK